MQTQYTHRMPTISFSATLLLVVLTTAATLHLTSASITAAPSQPPSPPEIRPPPPPSPSPSTPHAPPPAAIQEKQLRNILDALIGTGDYGGWANLLSSANRSSLPLTATLFVPSNAAISRLLSATTAGAQVDPLLLPYHIVPQRLTFSDLRALTTRTRLPTLLPSNFIVVTNNSPANFAVDESQILQADIFLNAAFALHGVDKVLNYSVFGGGTPLSPPPTTPVNASFRQRKKKKRPHLGEREPHSVSGSRRSCARIWVILSSFLMFYAFKIL